MIIKSVELRNFLSHERTEVHFPLGVTVIVGPNGAGKSSILDAMLFALFRERARGERLEDLIRRGADTSRVKLVFEEGGVEYVVERTLSRRGRGGSRSQFRSQSRARDAQLRRSGSRGGLVEGQRAVSEEILRTLGMDKDEVLNSIFVRQGEIAAIIEAEPAKRKELFGKLLGLEKLEKAYDGMKAVIDHFRSRLDELREPLAELKALQERRAQLDAEIRELELRIEGLEADFRECERRFEAARAALEAAEERRGEYERVRGELRALEERATLLSREAERLAGELGEAEAASERIKALEPEVSKIQILESLLLAKAAVSNLRTREEVLTRELERVRGLARELEATKDAYERFVGLQAALERKEAEKKSLEAYLLEEGRLKYEISSLEARISEMEREVGELEALAVRVLGAASSEAKERLIRSLEAERARKRGEALTLERRRGEALGRIAEIDETLRKIEGASECPVCGRGLDAAHKRQLMSRLGAERASLEALARELYDEIEALNAEIRRIDGRIKEASGVNVEYIENCKRELERARKELLEKKSRLAEITPMVEAFEGVVSDVDRLRGELEALRRDYQRHISVLKALETERAEAEVEEELEAVRGELREKLSEIERLESELGYAPEDPESELRRLRLKRSEYDRLKSVAERAELLRVRLEGVRAELRRTTEERERLNSRLEALGFSEEAYELAKREFEGLRGELEELNIKLRIARSLKDAKVEERRRLSQRIEELARLRDEMEAMRKFVEDLERIRWAFSKDGVQRLLREFALPLISERAGEYLEKFNIGISGVRIDEDFNIYVTTAAGELPIKSVSGGQKVAVGIALRLAIASALVGKVSTVVMDEPTAFLDEERVRELVDAMRSFFRGGGASIPQMILVSHHRELEDIADEVYVVENAGGVSKVMPAAR
ncbi:MAG: AAA family ATPase [Candidatus Alkanophagales archaeon]